MKIFKVLIIITLIPMLTACPPPDPSSVLLTIGESSNGVVTGSQTCRVETSPCEFEYSTAVELSASANAGYEFVSFRCFGEACPSPFELAIPRIFITLEDNLQVYAEFKENGSPPPSTVSLTLGESSNGIVSSLACSVETSPCEFDYGVVVELSASANDGYEFARWECMGSCSGSDAGNQISLTIDRDTDITPVFTTVDTPPDEMVTLTVEVGDGGHVDRVLGRSECNGPTICTYTVRKGESVEIDADHNPGYDFDRWSEISGNSYSVDGSNGSNIILTLDQNTTLRVTFSEEEEEPTIQCINSDIRSLVIQGRDNRVDLLFSLARSNCDTLFLDATLQDSTRIIHTFNTRFPVAYQGQIQFNTFITDIVRDDVCTGNPISLHGDGVGAITLSLNCQ